MHKDGWYASDKVKNLRGLLERSAEKYGRRDAFRFKNAQGDITGVSYIQLLEDVQAFGTALYSLGLSGAHISLIGENSYEWMVSYLAVINGLGVIVPLDSELPDEEICRIIHDSDSSAVICSPAFIPAIKAALPALPKLKACIGMQAETGGLLSFYRLIENGRELLKCGECGYLDAKIDPESMRVILYTPGTTGSCKAVMLSHKNIVSVTNAALTAIKPEQVALSALPMHHSYECTCDLAMLQAGVTICISGSLKHLPENLRAFHPSMIILVPLFVETFYKRLMAEVKKTGGQARFNRAVALSNRLLRFHIDLRRLIFRRVTGSFGGSLRLIICGGAPLRAEPVARFRELGIQILNCYGITECAPLVAANRSCRFSDLSVGVVMPCCEVKIDSPDENGVGEVLVRGENVMLGYYKDDIQTAQALVGGWLKTGDLGRFDGEGFLQLTGRRANTVILSGGMNVQPEKIEEYLTSRIPYIKDVVVCAAAPGRQGESITAIVVPDMEYVADNGIIDLAATLEEDIRSANRELPAFWQLSGVRIQTDDFERTSLKKIKRLKITGEEMRYAGEN